MAIGELLTNALDIEPVKRVSHHRTPLATRVLSLARDERGPSTERSARRGLPGAA
jgi:hypothetical protein